MLLFWHGCFATLLLNVLAESLASVSSLLNYFVCCVLVCNGLKSNRSDQRSTCVITCVIHPKKFGWIHPTVLFLNMRHYTYKLKQRNFKGHFNCVCLYYGSHNQILHSFWFLPSRATAANRLLPSNPVLCTTSVFSNTFNIRCPCIFA